MKITKKIISFISLALVLTVLVSCGAESNKLTAPVADIVKSVNGVVDFSDVYLIYKSDDYSSDVLNYQYGITDDTIIGKITDFVLTEPDSLSAKTLGIIIFSDDITEEELNGVADTIKAQYVENRMDALKMYDPDQYAVAEATSVTVYDNAVVIVANDTSGNTAVLDAIRNAGK